MRGLLTDVANTPQGNNGGVFAIASQINTLNLGNPGTDWNAALGNNNANSAVAIAGPLAAGGMSHGLFIDRVAGLRDYSTKVRDGIQMPVVAAQPPGTTNGAGTGPTTTSTSPLTQIAAGYFAQALTIAGSDTPSEQEARDLASSIVTHFENNPMTPEEIDAAFGAGTADIVDAAIALDEGSTGDESLYYDFLNAASDAELAEIEAADEEDDGPSAYDLFLAGEAATTVGGASISPSDEYVANPVTGDPMSREDAIEALRATGAITDDSSEEEIDNALATAKYATVSADVARWVMSSGAQPHKVTANDPLFPNVEEGTFVYLLMTEETSREPGYFYDNVHLRTLSGRTQDNRIVVAEQRKEIDSDGETVPGTQETRKFLFDADGHTYDTTDTYQVNTGTEENPVWVTKGMSSTHLEDGDGNTADLEITFFDGVPSTAQVGEETVPTVGQENQETFYYDADKREWFDKNGNKVTDPDAIALIEKGIEETPHGDDIIMNKDLQHADNFIDGLVRLGSHRPLAAFATIIEGYQMMQGLRWLYGWVPGLRNEDVQLRKEKIKQDFCLAGGISNCVSSAICEDYLTGEIDWEAEGSLVVRGTGGMPELGVWVKSYKMGPITLRGASPDTLTAIFNSNYTVIDNVLYTFTDPDFDTYDLPDDKKAYLYQVNYFVSNVVGSRDVPTIFGGTPATTPLHWNLRWVGPYSAQWFPSNQVLQGGAQATGNLFKYSFNDYSKVCLTLDPPMESGESFGNSFSEVCQRFVSYETGELDDDDDTTYPPTIGGPTPGAYI
jgi:hypothetical protein